MSDDREVDRQMIDKKKDRWLIIAKTFKVVLGIVYYILMREKYGYIFLL